MKRELGWTAMVPLEEGLCQTIEWYKKNTAWTEAIRGGEYRGYYEKYYDNRDSSLEPLLQRDHKAQESVGECRYPSGSC